ncbi:MAG TPA: phosphotransferase, partial [Pyrinomonadaceae bacterium]|nr:phosphotransferase [Pyrinomonadaceae bacterium]
ACVFTEAPGEAFIYGSLAANVRHFRLRGQTLARIHALSKRYTPAADTRRHAWDEDELLRHTERYLPPSETIVWAEHAELINWLRDYPRDAETFGLIHGDFGQTNYRVAGDVLTAFDFDDCCYHWFAYDLAVIIYPHGWRDEANTLLDALLAGYADAGGRVSHSTGDLTRFCRLRQLYMFLHFARRWGFRNLSEQQADWFSQKRDNIARGYHLPPGVT